MRFAHCLAAKSAVGLIFGVFSLSLAAAPANADPYLYEKLANPVYKTTFRNLFKGKQIPPWLTGYIANSNGVDRPGTDVSLGERTYELYAVCEPHNCAGNFIYVLFQPDGQAAVALLTVDGAISQYFGNPNADQKQALVAASKE
jgi:hypothetical protein